ncbi:phosphodiester glycosidase family protein [bacterium]|nr:MAG: phosphodiester glycosidase family protein [bacterium]
MRRFFVLLGLVAMSWWSVGAYRARGEESWKTAGKGLESRSFYWQGVRIYAYRATPSLVKLGSGDYLDANGWLKKTKARVAINGGYFDGGGEAMGLRVSGGKLLTRLRRANWGVFWIKSGKAHIDHTRDYSPANRPDEAVQCGPRLVVAGKTTDLKPQWDRRTGLGIDRSGRVVLAVADGQLSLDEWAKVFAAGNGLNCRDALNLDGGGSTQLTYNSGSKRETITGAWPVPDAIIIR